MTITETDISIAQTIGGLDEINLILRGTEDHEQRMSLREKKAELTGEYWRLQQDKQRERQAAQ
jgi:hypothetical protein